VVESPANEIPERNEDFMPRAAYRNFNIKICDVAIICTTERIA